MHTGTRFTTVLGIPALVITTLIYIIINSQSAGIRETIIVNEDNNSLRIPLVVSYQNTSSMVERVEDIKTVHWLPDWYNKTDIGRVLSNRVEEVQKRCRTYTGDKNKWASEPKIRIARTKNLAYCHTAKAGSTFWRKLLQQVQKEKNKRAVDRMVSKFRSN